MGDFELRADFDHDGRLTDRQSEYDARHARPGALLVANIDADQRAFPNRVDSGFDITLDYDQPTKTASDDEVLAIRVKVNNPAAAAGRQFGLRLPGIHGVRIRIYDERGVIVPVIQDSSPVEHPIRIPTTPQLNLMLEARTCPGSPFGHALLLDTTFTPNGEDESNFVMSLFSRDAAQNEIIHDSGNFSVPPVLFLDNGVRATRLYMCDKPDTLAALTDTRAALTTIGGVDLVTVPESVSGPDTWLQDQFQPGIMIGAQGWRHVIIHLPRMRSGFVGRQDPRNLASFVTSHFPARNVGLMNDFWTRTLSFADLTGRRFTLKFTELTRLAGDMSRVSGLLEYLDDVRSQIDRTEQPPRNLSWSQARNKIQSIAEEVQARLRRAQGNATSEWRMLLENTRVDISSRLQQVNSQLPFGTAPDTFVLAVGTQKMEVSGDRADELFGRIHQLESSANYGGNIESSPPTQDAPLGKIVIGNARINGWTDHVDPDIQRFLSKQKQEIVEVDSTWLAVGHVDEMLVFTPDRHGSGQDFAVLRASSGLAMAILREASAQFRSGLPAIDPMRRSPYRPSGVLDRLTHTGTSPVTRLLRGKLWSHSHPAPGPNGNMPDILEPPRIYQKLSRALNGGDPANPSNPSTSAYNTTDIRYWPGQGPDRFYPADISVLELLYAESDNVNVSVNDFIEERFLAPVDQLVADNFGGARVFPMPVIFDRVASVQAWTDDQWKFLTSAFTPDVVNMQVLNGHLLIPRPFGPRMRADDVLAVLTSVLQDLPSGSVLMRQLNPRFFRRFGLDTTVCWIHRQNAVNRNREASVRVEDHVFGGLTTIGEVAQLFKDGFPGVSASDVADRILRDNRRNFTPTGQLRDGWRRFVIQENTIDLFEAYIQLVVNALGLTAHWIDSWFYHVNFGGIHCGTNVLRVPERGRIPNWWNV